MAIDPRCCPVPDNCILADPCHVATQGVLDCEIGIATLGWIVEAEPTQGPVLTPHVPGVSFGPPRKEWYVRRDVSDPWFGPLSFRDADAHARVMTRDGTPINVLYAQVGTFLGTRGGDPIKDPSVVFVDRMYANGKLYLTGRAAEFNKDKLP